MAQRKKAKPKRKSPSATKGKDEKQSARFIEMARTLGVDETGEKFSNAIGRVVKKAQKRQ